MDSLNNRITLLVNSCDKYDDLWFAFFTLLKKYWRPLDTQIIFNTESLDYTHEGLNIKCVHPRNKNIPYGERLLNALKYVETEYVIIMLDDFFLRDYVNATDIAQIVNWMDNDKNIVYFNCDCTPVYADWEDEKYPGYKRIPWGNEYILNMQAAVWRTDKFVRYWSNNVSPWEWELYYNINGAVNTKDKFYCAKTLNKGFCNYGYNYDGMGVFRGKWVMDDVQPLFEKEGIIVDFSKRGAYVKEGESDDLIYTQKRDSLIKRQYNSDLVDRCMPKFKRKYKRFVKKNKVLETLTWGCKIEDLFSNYILLKQRKKWHKKMRREDCLLKIRKNGIFNEMKRNIYKLVKK